MTKRPYCSVLHFAIKVNSVHVLRGALQKYVCIVRLNMYSNILTFWIPTFERAQRDSVLRIGQAEHAGIWHKIKIMDYRYYLLVQKHLQQVNFLL